MPGYCLRLAKFPQYWDSAVIIEKLTEDFKVTAQPDLNISVYCTDEDHDLIRLATEHSLTARIRRVPSNSIWYDLTPVLSGAPIPKPVNPDFQYIRDHHCEIHQADHQALKAFLSTIAKAVIAGSLSPMEVSLPDTLGYAKAQIQSQNKEWVTYTQQDVYIGSKWKKAIDKMILI